MLARLAEDLYWAGRFLERLQHTARVLDVTTDIVMTSPNTEEEDAWRRALATLVLEHSYRQQHEEINGSAVVDFCVIDPDNPGSVASLVRGLRENVRRARELVSSEFWESVNDLYLRFFRQDVKRDLDAHPGQLFALVKMSAQTVVGVAAETMSRDETTLFFELGMHMERAGTTIRVLGTQGAALLEEEGSGLETWSPVLRICAAREAFVRSGRTADELGIVGLLLFSATFPRSVRYSVVGADDHVRSLVGDEPSPIGRLLGRLRATLDFGDAAEVIASGLAPAAAELEAELRQVHREVATRFFHHTSPDAELHVQEVRALEAWSR